jgi:hypothetical protein
MKIRFILIASVLLAAPMAFGANYSLNNWCFYVNSLDINHSCSTGSGKDNFLPPVAPGTFDYVHLSGDNTLGTATATVGAGTYNAFAVFNYDIDGGGYNEYASTTGTLTIGQVYTVGAGGNTPGSVYSQFANGTLDNTNHVPACSTPGSCDDVAASVGFTNVVVPPGSTGTINFVVSDTPPPSGFYIGQTDTDTGDTIYISGNVQTNSDLGALTAETPEPTTLILMGGGFGLMLIALRRRKA